MVGLVGFLLQHGMLEGRLLAIPLTWKISCRLRDVLTFMFVGMYDFLQQIFLLSINFFLRSDLRNINFT